MNKKKYGDGSATYEAAGGLAGIRQLVDAFYTIMDEASEYRTIRNMHPKNLDISKDKLTCFLSGWMGGEPLFSQKYGPINITEFHAFIRIDEAERDMWIGCMKLALDQQDYPESLKQYLIEQLKIPAERIWVASVTRRQSS